MLNLVEHFPRTNFLEHPTSVLRVTADVESIEREEELHHAPLGNQGQHRPSLVGLRPEVATQDLLQDLAGTVAVSQGG